MLTSLCVHNLALIESLEIEPCAQLNILSGETGAGKSIIVDGIMLLLGARYDKTLLRYNTTAGYVEGVFSATPRAKDMCAQLGWEQEDEIIVTRRFHADGKNEIRINGHAASTSMLKQLTATLVDIYGQNEYQTLASPREHLAILDSYARDLAPLKAEYAVGYGEYKDVCARLRSIGLGAEREREIDLLRFQISEIDEAHTHESEEDELVERRNLIASAEHIYASLGETLSALSQREGSGSEGVDDALRSISGITGFKPLYAELHERLRSVSIELGDIADTLGDELGELSFDPDELEETEKRLAQIRALKRKYGSYADMCKFRARSAARLLELENADELCEQLLKKKQALTNTLYALGKRMHDVRVCAAEKFAESVKLQLHELGMEKADFSVTLGEFPPVEAFDTAFSLQGADTAEFFLSPNAGQPLKPLVKIISGGEMSRFMLALKVVASAADDIPTLIFDEIDAGISGTVGQVVAKKLATLAAGRQILCVTHLPQIASMADRHFFIEKHTVGEDTVTSVTPLDEDGMVAEISRLSGSRGISDDSDSNARAMKKWSNDFKASLSFK